MTKQRKQSINIKSTEVGCVGLAVKMAKCLESLFSDGSVAGGTGNTSFQPLLNENQNGAAVDEYIFH